MNASDFLKWTEKWILAVLPKIKPAGCFYLFATWKFSPEIFCFVKKHLHMINEIIWDRKVPSMGGTVRRFTSVHDNIGFFAKKKNYYFNLDPVRIPYDAETKKARSRAIFVGKKWLEMGRNPKDVWSVSRLHKLHRERENHPTQKPLALIERMVKASSPEGGTVLDPFAGSGTTLAAALKNGRNSIGFEINLAYCQLIKKRMEKISNKKNSTACRPGNKLPEPMLF